MCPRNTLARLSLNRKVLDIVMGKFSESSFSQSLRLSRDTVTVTVVPQPQDAIPLAGQGQGQDQPDSDSDATDTVSFSYTIPEVLCRPLPKSTQSTQLKTKTKPVLSTAAALAVLDEVSTYSFILKDKACRGGVSVHLTTEMLAPCSPGDKVTIKTTLGKIGKTLGFCDFEMVHEDTGTGANAGRVIARGQHIKHLPLGAAWDILSSPYVLPVAIKMHDALVLEKNPGPITRAFMRRAFGDLNQGKMATVDGVGGVFDAVALKLVGREGNPGNEAVVHSFLSTPSMNNVLGKLHGGAVAVALEEAALASYNSFHACEQGHVDALKHPDEVFLNYLSIRYLSALTGHLDISCRLDRQGLLASGNSARLQGEMRDGSKRGSANLKARYSPSVQFECSFAPVASLHR